MPASVRHHRQCRLPRCTLHSVIEREDGDREVALADELVILPDQTVDDTDVGWGERAWRNDDRLLADRPPHWD